MRAIRVIIYRLVQGAGPDEVLDDLQGLPVCSQACMKALSKEHKRSCENKEEVSADDALADQLEGLKLEQKRLWLVIPEQEQKTIAKYMDVHSVCVRDSVRTGRSERRV